MKQVLLHLVQPAIALTLSLGKSTDESGNYTDLVALVAAVLPYQACLWLACSVASVILADSLDNLQLFLLTQTPGSHTGVTTEYSALVPRLLLFNSAQLVFHHIFSPHPSP